MFGIGKKPAEGDQKLTQAIPSGWRIVDLGLLGTGGMSRVYRVRDEELNRDVALKVLRPELAREDESIDRFVDEAKITAQLDHPNIPPVYALSTDKKKTTCFTMKVLEGESMQQMIERRRGEGQDALFAALEVLVRVCDAVAFAHERGIFHCDLKPHNIMVGSHGQIYVVDWGLARRKADLPTAAEDSESAIGTPAYMAPEQARGQNHLIDERTDIFTLGGILYRILVGRPPYVGTTAEGTLLLAEKADVLSPDIATPAGKTTPRRLIAICMKALAPRPADRYQTVADLKRDLEDFIRGTARLPELVFQAGEPIVKEGDPGDCAYIIVDGHCQASRKVAGKTEMLRLLGPGEMFGEAAVLTGNPRLATVTALMDTTVAVVDRTYLEEEMQRTSHLALAIRTIAAAFVDLNGQTTAMLRDKSYERAFDLALRELALNGQNEGSSRWVTWKVLLGRICEETGLPPDGVSERIARQKGVRIDLQADRLILTP
jgi:eukaryotic-like serine/threonine-protein kinase